MEGKKIKAFIAKVLARIKSNYKMHNHFCTCVYHSAKEKTRKNPAKKAFGNKNSCAEDQKQNKRKSFIKKRPCKFCSSLSE
jgi:hypothetical protein